jgi:hypothetical protein
MMGSLIGLRNFGRFSVVHDGIFDRSEEILKVLCGAWWGFCDDARIFNAALNNDVRTLNAALTIMREFLMLPMAMMRVFSTIVLRKDARI